MEPPGKFANSLSHPTYNSFYRWTPTEEKLLLEELPGLWIAHEATISNYAQVLPQSAELERFDRNRFRSYFQEVCKTMSRLDLFGHIDMMTGFVEPGQLTTRFELSLGIMNVVSKHLSTDSKHKVICAEDYEIVLAPYFDILEMPNVDMRADMINKMNQRPYDPAKHSTYIKWLYNHLPASVAFIWNIRTTSPNPAIKLTKPYLRVFTLGGKGEYVFVDEVKLALSRLKPALAPSAKTGKMKWQYMYFPFEYLNHALGMWGFSQDNLELVGASVKVRRDNIHCFIEGPNSENVLPAESCFFRFAQDVGKLDIETNGEEVADTFDSYTMLLTTGHMLPYFVRYFTRDKRNRATCSAMRDYMGRRKYISKFSKKTKIGIQKSTRLTADELVSKKPVQSVPVDAFQKIPGNNSFALQMMTTHNRFALLLHEQGYCDPGVFCYATVMKVEEVGFPCEVSEELMKKRIEFSMRDDLKECSDRNKFLSSVRKELVTFYKPPPEEEGTQEGEDEEEEKEVKKKNKKSKLEKCSSTESAQSEGDGCDCFAEDDLIIKSGKPTTTDTEDVYKKPVWLNNSESVSSASSGCSDVHPDGTETAVPPAVEEPVVVAEEVVERKKVETEEDYQKQCRAKYEKMIKTIEQEHAVSLRKLRKLTKSLGKQQVEDRSIIEKQKLELRECKNKLETCEIDYKEIVTKLEGDIKRISAEKTKVEDSFEQFKTMKALDDPTSILLENKKIIDKLIADSIAQKNLIASKDREIEAGEQKLKKQLHENEELKSANLELTQGVSTNKEVVALQLKLKDLECKLEVSELKSSHKDEQFNQLMKHSKQADGYHYSLKTRLSKMEAMSQEKDRIMESKKLLENCAESSVKAAVKRFEALNKQLDESKNDETIFNHCYRRLKAYEAVEDPSKYQLVLEAHQEYDTARAAKIILENELMVAIEEIKTGPSKYYMMKNVFANRKRVLPFSPKISNRMSELQEKIEAKLRDDLLSNPRHKYNK